ncbi:hypothetical protein [Microbacterium rhizosphaerae]|uniref:Amino acid transporter n=1 Tax=Microbacterium rhizosphaerae TaxID=1678237 RepID=A0ABZ0SPQ3_9MICO|nr:hypothetical protein [Microbacterium rhizosphaerae]WPR91346.1 hypothetical protein SM116_08740 [Microbacterium rhizosphaerae]
MNSALSGLRVLVFSAIIIAVICIVLGVALTVGTANSYNPSASLLAYSFLALGGAFIPIAFIVGAISLHAHAVTAKPAAARLAPAPAPRAQTPPDR